MKVKTIKLTAFIADADLIRKRKQVVRFAEQGLTTNVSLTLKGRQRDFKQRAEETMLKFTEEFVNHKPPAWNGLVLSTTVTPTK